jgi:hypothetical protein
MALLISAVCREIADLVAASNGDDLDLAGRNIKSMEAAFFEQSKDSMLSKRSIDLSYNNLRELPAQFSTLCSLESLNLSYNSFKGDVPPQISSLSQLTCLKLNMNGVTCVQVLTNLQKLRILQVFYPRFFLSMFSFLTLKPARFADWCLFGEPASGAFRALPLRAPRAHHYPK